MPDSADAMLTLIDVDVVIVAPFTSTFDGVSAGMAALASSAPEHAADLRAHGMLSFISYSYLLTSTTASTHTFSSLISVRRRATAPYPNYVGPEEGLNKILEERLESETVWRVEGGRVFEGRSGRGGVAGGDEGGEGSSIQGLVCVCSFVVLRFFSPTTLDARYHRYRSTL